MQSSYRPDAPRLVTISANPSSSNIPVYGGVQIDREVVVTSHQRVPSRRASYSPAPPLPPSSHGHSRAQSQWDPSEKSVRRHSRRSMSQLDSTDPVQLHTNRESMRALAEFLMTKEPPPNNWVSMQSDDEFSLRTVKKFKMFGSQSKKKKRVRKAPKFLQLPDVAVAAMTLQGSRHIAISIPLEHDYPELLRPSPELNRRVKSAPRLYTSDKGTVTVLKPVVEVRESVSFSTSLGNNDILSDEKTRLRAASDATSPAEILGVETTRTLENYYLQLHKQRKPGTEGSQPDTSKGRIYVDATALAVPVAPTTKPDPRHSGGTIYSTATFSTAPGHSRGVSSASTATSVIPGAGLRPDLPARASSKSNFPASIDEELKLESARNSALESSPRGHALKSSTGSFKSDSSYSAPTIFGTATAETAKGYHSPGPQYFSRSNTPSASAAPTKKLPDIPVGGPVARSVASPLSNPNSAIDPSAKETNTTKNNTTEPAVATQQSRQERVKARKQRDMAAIRAKLDHTALLTPQINHTSPQTNGVHPPLRRTSHNLTKKQTLNTIAPIMVVANLSPFTGMVLKSDLPSPPPAVRRMISRKTSSVSTVKIYTPPRSIHDGSDSETIPPPQAGKFRTKSGSSKSGTSVLGARREERRRKRNMTLHEKELDARMTKIEKDNAMLLHTLSGIATSFGQLNRLIPESRERIDEWVQGGVDMEPFVRDLQGNSKTGREFKRLRLGENGVDTK